MALMERMLAGDAIVTEAMIVMTGGADKGSMLRKIIYEQP